MDLYKIKYIDYYESCTIVELKNPLEKGIKYYAKLYSEPEQLMDYLGDNYIAVESSNRDDVINAIKSTIQDCEQSFIDNISISDIHVKVECSERNHRYNLDDLEWGEIINVDFVKGNDTVIYVLGK